tara:strand:+ start:3169 stop:4023 length:855 start_codon:yes stop_codon:yes gene_type:complete
MTDIRVVVPSFPEGIELKSSDVDDFYNWLTDDLRGYATVERITLDKSPKVTKWSGKVEDNTYNHFYTYQFEHCLDSCQYDYIARIETDFHTNDWDKFEKALLEDFDLITLGLGPTHRHAGDVSFAVFKRDLLLSVEDLMFTMSTNRKIQFNYNYNSDKQFRNTDGHILFDKNQFLHKSDEQFRYDIFQWAIFRCIEKSDKVYLMHPLNVKTEHYVGMTQQASMYRRIKFTTQTPQLTDFHAINKNSVLMKYIEQTTSEIDINNYNLFPPYKILVEKFCEDCDKQ